jgi:hypothetical protein
MRDQPSTVNRQLFPHMRDQPSTVNRQPFPHMRDQPSTVILSEQSLSGFGHLSAGTILQIITNESFTGRHLN